MIKQNNYVIVVFVIDESDRLKFAAIDVHPNDIEDSKALAKGFFFMSRHNSTRSRSSQRGRRPYSSSGGRSRPSNHQRSQRRGPKKEYIHPSKFVRAAKPTQEDQPFRAQNKFGDFNMAPLLKQNITRRGFDAPSPIQDEIIPHGLAGRDVIGISNTGTGKTLAFALPVLNSLINNPNSKAIVIAPTRELANQILDECKTLLVANRSVRWTLLIGGTSMYSQLKDLSRGASLVIGTPGRIKDHLERGSLKLNRFDLVVLDEVDRMLDMGFVNDMRKILGQTAQKRQSFFFSATIDAKVKTLIGDFSNDPILVSVKKGDTADTVEQNIVGYRAPHEKIDKLHDLLIADRQNKVLIFDDTRRSVEKLKNSLESRGFTADAIHGGRSQGQRRRTLSKFKDNHVNILVATDVAARGIDVKDITHVINYSTPQTYDDYIHRIGRAGRAGQPGLALTFIQQ